MSSISFNNKWEEILKIIQENLSPQIFNTWFSGVKYINLKDNELILAVPNLFCKNWLEKNYYQFIKDILVDQIGIDENVLIKFQVDSLKTPGQSKERKRNTNLDDLQKKYNKTGLNPDYTFNNFKIGDSNRFAHAACMAVAQSPAKSYNPLFIYGGVGLGKPHLMHAIGNYIINKNSIHSINIAYISAEKFTNELINSIRDDTNESFRERYRSLDVLLIDDIQFLAGKERTQEEFFHIFNALHQDGKQIILSSDRAPREIPDIEDRLISRFSWGLSADLQVPEYETRYAILERKANDNGIELSHDVLEFIAHNFKSNVRDLEGAIIKLLAFASLQHVDEIEPQMAKRVLKDMIQESHTTISIEQIQNYVCDYFGIDTNKVREKTRKQEIVEARQIAMYLAKQFTDSSLKTIGLHFGGRDHSTVIHAISTVEERMQTTPKHKRIVDELHQKIEVSTL